MAGATSYGLHGSPWIEIEPFNHVTRAAKFYLWSQVDSGHGCPISMTYAVLPALARNADLSRELAPQIGARAYDPRLLPRTEKTGMIFGMGMTEKQGGSDVRANQTRAVAVLGGRHGNGEEYVLSGHKWFCSAPMSDAFLVLAQADGTVLSGILRSETETVLDLISPDLTPRRVPKSEIEARRVGTVSLMPKGLVDRLTPAEFADLTAYLGSLTE